MALKIPAQRAAYRLLLFAESLTIHGINARYPIRPLEAAKAKHLVLEIDLEPDNEAYYIPVDKEGLVELEDVEKLREIVHRILADKNRRQNESSE